MSALNSSVVSAATADGHRLFQRGNSPWGKKNTSGHHYKSGSCNTVSCVMTWYRSCTLIGGQVLVLINRHSPTMNLVKVKQRGLIPGPPELAIAAYRASPKHYYGEWSN